MDESPEEARPELPPVTTAAEWRKKARAVFRVTLPSGATVIARKIDVTTMIGDGELSADVFDVAAQTPAGRYKIFKDASRVAAPRIAVSPRIVAQNGEPTSEDDIVLDDIPVNDLTALFMWAAGFTALPATEVTD